MKAVLILLFAFIFLNFYSNSDVFNQKKMYVEPLMKEFKVASFVSPGSVDSVSKAGAENRPEHAQEQSFSFELKLFLLITALSIFLAMINIFELRGNFDGSHGCE